MGQKEKDSFFYKFYVSGILILSIFILLSVAFSPREKTYQPLRLTGYAIDENANQTDEYQSALNEYNQALRKAKTKELSISLGILVLTLVAIGIITVVILMLKNVWDKNSSEEDNPLQKPFKKALK